MTPLDVEKAVQAFGVLLRRAGKRADKLRLLKLLYIADRNSIEKTGTPILGSKFVAMKHGPLHSEVFDLMNGYHQREPLWSAHFRIIGHDISIETEPETGALSRHEIELLNAAVDETVDLGDWEVIDRTHAFPEWKKNYPNPTENTSRRIPFVDILDAVGRINEKEAILQDLKDEAAFSAFFAKGVK